MTDRKVKMRFIGLSPHAVDGFSDEKNPTKPGDILEMSEEQAEKYEHGLFERVDSARPLKKEKPRVEEEVK